MSIAEDLPHRSSDARRTAWIDVARGIAIVLVVLGHSPYLSHMPAKVFNVIFSFHIPLFFFISGYVFRPDVAFGRLLATRFRSVLRPYFFTTGIISIAYIAARSGPSWGWYFFWGLYGNGPNLPKTVLHLWFLPCLFITVAFVWCLFKLFKNTKRLLLTQALVFAGLVILGFLCIHLFWNVPVSWTGAGITRLLAHGVLENPAYVEARTLFPDQFVLNGLPWCIDLLLIAAAFFMAGCLGKQNRLESLLGKTTPALIAILVFLAFHYFYNDTIDLNVRRYDNLVVSTVLACAGIYICLYLARAIALLKNSISDALEYLGRHALVIFVFHSIVQSKVYYGFSGLMQEGRLAFFAAFVSALAIPLVLNYLLLERFGALRYWYYGK